MPLPHQVWRRQTAYDYLDGVELADRQQLFFWIERLGQNPYRDGDFSEKANDGRECQVKVLSRHAVIWWVDAPVCEVKIVTIRPADQ